MKKKGVMRIIALCLSIMLFVQCWPCRAGAEDYLFDLFLDMLWLEAMQDWDWSDDGGSAYSYGVFDEDDVYYTDDEGYDVYLDTHTGYLFGVYTNSTAYIVGHDSLLSGNPSSLTNIQIPSEVMGWKVSAVEAYAFSNVKNIQHVVIPEGVEMIGVGAFSGCDLRSISLPGTLTSIEYDAFEACSNLSSVILPDGLEFIGSEAFYDCDSLNEIDIPDSVEEIHFDAFYHCDNLRSVHLGRGLTAMEGNIFGCCPNLNDLQVDAKNPVYALQDGVLINRDRNSIVRYPCNGSTSPEIVISDGIEVLEYGCFGDANNIARIILPDSITAIEDFALSECHGLEYLWLGNQILSIGNNAIPLNRMEQVYLPRSIGSLQELSLFYYTDREVIGTDDERFVVEADSYAAKWADLYGLGYVIATAGMTAPTVGGTEDKPVALTVSPEHSYLGERVVFTFDTNEASGKVTLNAEGKTIGTANIVNGQAVYAYVPPEAGVFTVSAMVGDQTVARCQMLVSGDEPLTVQHLPPVCYHEAAHLRQFDHVTVTKENINDADYHMTQTTVSETWICARCREYHIDSPISMNREREPHQYDYKGVCECGHEIEERYSFFIPSKYYHNNEVFLHCGTEVKCEVFDRALNETVPMDKDLFELKVLGEGSTLLLVDHETIRANQVGRQEVAVYDSGEEVARFSIVCTNLELTKDYPVGSQIVTVDEMSRLDWDHHFLELNNKVALENFHASMSTDDGSYTVSFVAHNSGPLAYGVYAFNPDGTIYQRAFIGGYWYDSSILRNHWDALTGLGKMLIQQKDPTRFIDVESTQIQLTVPAGGYIGFVYPKEDMHVYVLNAFAYIMGWYITSTSGGDACSALGDFANKATPETWSKLFDLEMLIKREDLNMALKTNSVDVFLEKMITQEQVDVYNDLLLDILVSAGVDYSEDVLISSCSAMTYAFKKGVDTLMNGTCFAEFSVDFYESIFGEAIHFYPHTILVPGGQ